MSKSMRQRFVAESLPAWARKHDEVIEVARRDIAFRGEVYRAATKEYQDILIEDAKSREKVIC